MADKIKYIETNTHAMIGTLGQASDPLEPGGRILVDEDNDTHKQLLKLIAAKDPSVEHLSLVEVDPAKAGKAEEEKQEMLAKAEKIAAEAREEEDRKTLERLEEHQEVAESQSPHSDPTDFPPQDEEAQRLAEQSGPGQRATTQEDVVEEESSPKQGRRRSSTSSRSKG